MRRGPSRVGLVAVPCVMALTVGCGGRTAGLGAGDEGAGGAAASGGATESGGAWSTGGTIATGGAIAAGGAWSTGGAIATGGAVSAGGGPSTCACPFVPPCQPGYTLQNIPGSCCLECVPQCDVPCPPVTCGPGYTLQQAPGACCPECVPDSTDSCAAGLQRYEQLRSALVAKYAVGCSTNADCTVAPEANACAQTSCSDPVLTSMLSSLQSNLNAEASADCGSCSAPVPAPACSSLVFALCSMGTCTAQMVSIP